MLSNWKNSFIFRIYFIFEIIYTLYLLVFAGMLIWLLHQHTVFFYVFDIKISTTFLISLWLVALTYKIICSYNQKYVFNEINSKIFIEYIMLSNILGSLLLVSFLNSLLLDQFKELVVNPFENYLKAYYLANINAYDSYLSDSIIKALTTKHIKIDDLINILYQYCQFYDNLIKYINYIHYNSLSYNKNDLIIILIKFEEHLKLFLENDTFFYQKFNSNLNDFDEFLMQYYKTIDPKINTQIKLYSSYTNKDINELIKLLKSFNKEITNFIDNELSLNKNYESYVKYIRYKNYIFFVSKIGPMKYIFYGILILYFIWIGSSLINYFGEYFISIFFLYVILLYYMIKSNIMLQMYMPAELIMIYIVTFIYFLTLILISLLVVTYIILILIHIKFWKILKGK